jgi:hypothetical protein
MRNTLKTAFAACALLCASTLAHAPLSAMEASAPKAFVCAFNSGEIVSVENGTVRKRATSDKITVTFAAIDSMKQTAQMIGNAGSSDVTLIESDTSYSFVEVTLAGHVNLTTIFRTELKSGGFFAVHSRHINIVGPFVSELLGSCTERR